MLLSSCSCDLDLPGSNLMNACTGLWESTCQKFLFVAFLKEEQMPREIKVGKAAPSTCQKNLDLYQWRNERNLYIKDSVQREHSIGSQVTL